VATPPTIVTPLVVGSEGTSSIGGVASMGADDDVHVVDGGGYPITEASEVVEEASTCLVKPPTIVPPHIVGN